MRASELVEIAGDPLETLRRCGGYYNAKRQDESLRGPIVGYAGEYEVSPVTGSKNAYVGYIYYNFAKAEQYWQVMRDFARRLAEAVAIDTVGPVDCVLGAPLGALAIGQNLAQYLDAKWIFPEKEVTEAKRPGVREKSVLQMGRHDIPTGARILIAEDVTNNFSTTALITALVEAVGSQVVGIATCLNRSGQRLYELGGRRLPVMSMIWAPTDQFRQEEQPFADLIASGQLVPKPKPRWDELVAAMADWTGD